MGVLLGGSNPSGRRAEEDRRAGELIRERDGRRRRDGKEGERREEGDVLEDWHYCWQPAPRRRRLETTGCSAVLHVVYSARCASLTREGLDK